MLKRLLIIWNNRFKYDKLYREEFNIPFNSKQHRETNQIDVFLYFYEKHLIKESIKEYKKGKQYEKIKGRRKFLNYREPFDSEEEALKFIKKIKFGK